MLKLSKFKYLILSFIFVYLFLLQPSISNAVETSNIKDDLRENRMENKEKLKENRCNRLTTSIDKRIEKYKNNKFAHLRAYQNMRERVAKFIEKLDKRGLDTTQLKDDLKTLDEKIENAGKDYEAFIQALADTKEHACGESEGAFKDGVEGAKDQMAKVREDIRDIKKFYQTVIRPDITNLISQKTKEGGSDE